MNSVNLIGRLTAKPIFEYTNSNVAYARFTLAIKRSFKNVYGERQADFINCVAYRKTAELINQYTDKGDLLGVEGRIQTGSYTAQDGSKRYTFDLVVENITFINSKKSNAVQKNNATSEHPVNEEQTDIFSDFGENVAIEDDFLD